MIYKLFFSKHAQKDAEKIKQCRLTKKCQDLLALIEIDPFASTPPYEKLGGDLKGLYSRRINIHHRLIYEVNESEKIVKVLRMWSHYE